MRKTHRLAAAVQRAERSKQIVREVLEAWKSGSSSAFGTPISYGIAVHLISREVEALTNDLVSGGPYGRVLSVLADVGAKKSTSEIVALLTPQGTVLAMEAEPSVNDGARPIRIVMQTHLARVGPLLEQMAERGMSVARWSYGVRG